MKVTCLAVVLACAAGCKRTPAEPASTSKDVLTYGPDGPLHLYWNVPPKQPGGMALVCRLTCDEKVPVRVADGQTTEAWQASVVAGCAKNSDTIEGVQLAEIEGKLDDKIEKAVDDSSKIMRLNVAANRGSLEELFDSARSRAGVGTDPSGLEDPAADNLGAQIKKDCAAAVPRSPAAGSSAVPSPGGTSAGSAAVSTVVIDTRRDTSWDRIYRDLDSSIPSRRRDAEREYYERTGHYPK